MKKMKGYDITDFDGTGMMEIQRIDELGIFKDDEEAVEQAIKDGIKLIPIDELPSNFERKYMEDKDWKDVTSYNQRDTERIPSTLELRRLTPFNTRLVIHRHIYYPDTWLVSCGGTSIDKINLYTNDVEEAKHLAIDYMIDYAEKLLDKWSNIIKVIKEK